MYKTKDIITECVGLSFPELYELKEKGKDKYLAMICIINHKITVEYPTLDGEVIFEGTTMGRHCFLPSERENWLKTCKEKLVEFLNSLPEEGEKDGLSGEKG